MLLVQRPAPFPTIMPGNMLHRRNPSAPNIVVQPTRTPGLLSLSKPAASSKLQRTTTPRPPQPLHSQQRTPKSPNKAAKRASMAAAEEKRIATATTPAPTRLREKPVPITQTVTPAPTPERPTRGRQHAKASATSKDKEKTSNRSASRSTTRPARRPNHQLSPPRPIPSQAEVPTSPIKINQSQRFIDSHNLFDPFLSSDSDSDPVIVPHSPPTLTARPSGKLARRRQRGERETVDARAPTPSPMSRSWAIKVPSVKKDGHVRSASVAVPFPRRPVQHRSVTLEPSVFPICDDSLSDIDPDESSDDMLSIRSAGVSKTVFDTPLRSAPLSSSFGGFSEDGMPVTPPRSNIRSKRPRTHQRTVSEVCSPVSSSAKAAKHASLSAMASKSVSGFDIFFSKTDDESSISTPLDGNESDELRKALFGVLNVGSDARAASLRRRAMAAYFANSTFQNSPSPEVLPPPPSFML